MTCNVFITLRDQMGAVLDHRAGHNTWTSTGRDYLAGIASYSNPVAETPFETRRIKYMGLGIGSVTQATNPAVMLPPLSTSYPPGADPNATTGVEYNAAYPIDPPITTLERPIRIFGGSAAYPGAPADIWLIQPPNFFALDAGLGLMEYHGIVDTNLSQVLYAPFATMPLSEVGLFLSGADVNDAYNNGQMVAYHSFGTLTLSPGSVLEIVWQTAY
jgi:hypothetical protein